MKSHTDIPRKSITQKNYLALNDVNIMIVQNIIKNIIEVNNI